jgi:hypothetical protein
MNTLKWSNGIPYERTMIKKKINVIENTNNNNDNNDNKKEISNNKMNERIMYSQINKNPFLLENNYINDLEIETKFLRPKNSNIDK